MLKTKHYLLFALLSVALPGALVAQQQPAGAAAAPSQEQMQQWVTELQQLHGKLEAIQARAISDPQLQAAQQALGAEVKAEMEKIDPQLPATIDRVEELEAEAVKAQEAGDEEKLQQLGQEAQSIQSRFLQAQTQVFQQPAMAAKLEAFQSQLESKMAEVDAEAPALIERFKELEMKLASAMQGAQQQP